MPISITPNGELTEERMREVAEEVAVGVARRLRLAGFDVFDPERKFLMFYADIQQAGGGSRIVLEGDVEKYNENRLRSFEAINEAAIRADDADDSSGDTGQGE